MQFGESTCRTRRVLSTAAAAVAAALLVDFIPTGASAQTVNGNAFALRSSGALSGVSDWQLTSNGFVGTYVTLASPGTVSFALSASGVTDGGAAPRMNLAVNDTKVGWDVAAGFNTYNSSVHLPAGTHFIRTEYANDVPSAASRSLTVRNVQVTGATVNNSSTDALALSAANTYIDNYRKGPASVSLTGPGNIPLLPGTQVAYDMKRNAFSFGGTVSGVTNNDSKDMLRVNPAVGTEAHQFQQFINQYFNTIVPSNAGKWASNEPTQGNLTMTLVDKQLDYAQAHNMRARMHNLLWGDGTAGGNQQPAWVNTLISQAAAGNATAKANLRNAITSRINYYAGTTGNRSLKYVEVDGLNEAMHEPSYWQIFSPTTGVGSFNLASVYNEMAAAATAAGNPNLKLFLNEYNVLQFSPATINSSGTQVGSDQYANWYRDQVDAVRNAGGAVSGVGIQEYTSLTATGSNVHSAATIQKALQNLSIAGLDISMTEWGMGSGTTVGDRETLGPGALDSTMRMFYGNPLATSFMMWGWWDVSGATPPAQMIVTTPGNPTYTIKPLGQKWIDLMNEFATHGVATVNPDGTIDFNGFYGDYNIGNQSGFSNLILEKGTTGYSLQLATPPQWSLWNTSVSGAWGTGGNWSAGGVADAAGQTAYFGPAGAARAISVDGARTVGMLAFDSANPYTISTAGGGSITLEGNADVAAIYVVNGNHTVSAPLSLNDDLTVHAAAGTGVTVSNFQPAPTRTIAKTGPGSFATNAIRAAGLTINDGTVALLPGGGPSSLGLLSMTPTATLDLDDTDLVTGTARSTIESLVRDARNNGAWDQPGITSSAARANTATGLAVLSGAEWLGFGNTDFQGLAVAPTDTVVKYTWNGDTNLNGVVNFDDYVQVDVGFNTGLTGWANGDFNYSGDVNFDDYVLIDIAFNVQSGTLGRAIRWLTGEDRSESGHTANGLGEVIEHFQQFGIPYAQAFLAAVPEPSLCVFASVPIGSTLLRRRRQAPCSS